MKKLFVQFLLISFALFMSLCVSAQNENDPAKVDKKEIKKDSDVPPPPPPPPSHKGMFSPVEVMPRFPGCKGQKLDSRAMEECGKKEMLEYVYKNLVYPAEAKKKGVEGMAVVQFYVDTDGSMKDLKLVRDVPEGCGNAALAVMQKMQSEFKWIPGKRSGKAVKVQYTMPIKFKL